MRKSWIMSNQITTVGLSMKEIPKVVKQPLRLLMTQQHQLPCIVPLTPWLKVAIVRLTWKALFLSVAKQIGLGYKSGWICVELKIYQTESNLFIKSSLSLSHSLILSHACVNIAYCLFTLRKTTICIYILQLILFLHE